MTDQSSGMTVQRVDTAVVFIDPQNDVLSEQGTSWEAVGASVIENRTRSAEVAVRPDEDRTVRLSASARLTGYLTA